MVLSGIPLSLAHLAESTEQIFDIVFMYEFAGPGSGLIEIFDSTFDILRPVLGGLGGRFSRSVVIVDPWSGVRWFNRAAAVQARSRAGVDRA